MTISAIGKYKGDMQSNPSVAKRSRLQRSNRQPSCIGKFTREHRVSSDYCIQPRQSLTHARLDYQLVGSRFPPEPGL